VQQLAKAGYLNPDTLRERYYKELRPNLLTHESRHDLTMKLWLEPTGRKRCLPTSVIG
jgi:hypothetical protein